MASDLSNSKRLRSLGNDVFAEGSSECLAPVVRSGRLLKACKLYTQALNASRTNDERAKCSKNLGAVHWKHAKLTLEISEGGKSSLLQDRPPAFDVERSIEHYLAALKYGRASHQSVEWRRNIQSNLEEIARHIVYGEGWLLGKPEFLANVNNLFTSALSSGSSPTPSKSNAWAILQLGQAQHLLNKAVKELRIKDANGVGHYRQSLALLHRCHSPIEEASKHAGPQILEDIQTLKASVESCRCVCESIQIREAGKRILEDLPKAKDKAAQNDLVTSALDKFKEAAVIARGIDAECEGEALTCVGDVYRDVFNKDKRAIPYYSEAVDLAQDSQEMRSAKWYEKAKQALGKMFKSKPGEGGGGAASDSHSDVMPEIKADVEKIETEYKNHKTEEFLMYLYAEHPPRGPNGSSKFADLNGSTNTRLALRKAIQHYHPDHNGAVDDDKWLALCGEITRLLLEKHRLYQ